MSKQENAAAQARKNLSYRQTEALLTLAFGGRTEDHYTQTLKSLARKGLMHSTSRKLTSLGQAVVNLCLDTLAAEYAADPEEAERLFQSLAHAEEYAARLRALAARVEQASK